MNNRRRKKRNQRILVVALSLIIVLSLAASFVRRSPSSIEQFLSNTVQTVEYYLFKKPFDFISDTFSEYYELRSVYEENKLLKEKLDSFASVEAKNEVLENDVKKLKEVTGIKYLPSEYKTKVAGVLTRDQTNWNNEITIDSGSMSSIEVGMAVCDSKGMVGIVTNVNEISANVSLLTNEAPTKQIPVMIINGDQTVYGLIDGYDVNKGYINMTLLSSMDKLEKDAKVYTSGLGGDGKSPKGIYIGTAKKMYTKNDGTTSSVRIKPAADFGDLSYVSVVKKVN